MGAHVALLRGINVGGKNALPMKQLATMFESAKCSNVRTYIQSGNVVFEASDAVAARIADVISAAIAKQFKLEVPIVMRSAPELRAVLRGNPFNVAGVDENALHVGFLAARPGRAAIAALDPNRSPGDEYVVLGSEIYIHVPNGMGKSKLTNQYFDSKLATVTTVRNWRTVTTVLEMAEGE